MQHHLQPVLALFRAGRDLCRSPQGNVTVLTGVAMGVLALATMITVETVQLQTVRNRAQLATDAALLGAMATQSTTDMDAEFTALFNANFNASVAGSRVQQASISQSGNEYIANVVLSMPNSGIVGRTSTTMNISATATRNGGTSTTQLYPTVELTLVFQATAGNGYYASGTPYDAIVPLKPEILNGAKDIIRILSDSVAANKFSVSIVPFDQFVNLGTRDNYNKWVDSTTGKIVNPYLGMTSASSPPNTDSADTINARSPNARFLASWRLGTKYSSTHHLNIPATQTAGNSDIYPNPSQKSTTYFEGNITASTYYDSTRAQWMPYPLKPIVTNMKDTAQIMRTIDELTISVGASHIDTGMQWAWNTLSPKWQGKWVGSASNFPASFSGDTLKVVVLISDGNNAVWYKTDSSGNNVASNLRDPATLDICTSMKQQGIVIYAVDVDARRSNASPLLSSCVSKPGYYSKSTNTTELQNAFKRYADSIVAQGLRLTQ